MTVPHTAPTVNLSSDCQVSTSRLANVVAPEIYAAFDGCQRDFREITQRARKRFVERDWPGMQSDAVERLEVYTKAVDAIGLRVRELLQERLQDRLAWVCTKAVYSGLIIERHDWEIAETFFNSVNRRIFTTVGVDQEIEFVHTDYASPPTPQKEPIHWTYSATAPDAELMRRILADYDLPLTEAELDTEAAAAASAIERQLRSLGRSPLLECIEMVKSPFFRGEYMYLIGRIITTSQSMPIVLCWRHVDEGIYIDGVLFDESDISLLFSFARSYFHVEVERPYALSRFIKSIVPRKPTAEIYIGIGYNRHGKTELYRHALRHLANSSDKYQMARGQRGMVMSVFTMPSYPVVFKIIKDQFDYPKTTTRQSVIGRYRLVFKHDRAGRLIDAQEYEYLELDRRRFEDALIDELLHVASETINVVGNRVIIKHCYAERRVTPLNIFLQDADEEAARAAVIDYGQTIKDLAKTNIWPGDLLLKNFGVTRQQRLVFYDYDEICLLTDCNIRRLPESDDYDDEMAAEPWFAVSDRDMFPEEFKYFLGLPPKLREVFMEHHADLLEVDNWQRLQQRLRDGEIFHVAPYGHDKRLHRNIRQDDLDERDVLLVDR